MRIAPPPLPCPPLPAPPPSPLLAQKTGSLLQKQPQVYTGLNCCFILGQHMELTAQASSIHDAAVAAINHLETLDNRFAQPMVLLHCDVTSSAGSQQEQQQSDQAMCCDTRHATGIRLKSTCGDLQLQ